MFRTALAVVTLLVARCHCDHLSQNSRRAEINRLIGYMPVNDISDLAAIDLDLYTMEELVLSRKLNHAKLLYSEGGHSQSYATLTLENPEGDGDYPIGSKVWGYNENNLMITGKLIEEVKWTSNSGRRLQDDLNGTAAAGADNATSPATTGGAPASTGGNSTGSGAGSTGTAPISSGNGTAASGNGTSASGSGNHTRIHSGNSTTVHSGGNGTSGTASNHGSSSATPSSPFYKGNITLKVMYDRDIGYTPHCQVGALHVVSEGELEFCFAKQSHIKIGVKGTTRNETKSYNYTYNVHMENKNLRTLQTIAREASTFRGMRDFDLFYQYYGDYDYADRWVMAAADGVATNFKSGLGNADFATVEGRLGRGEALLKGAVFMNLYMYIIAKLEMAVKACQAQEHHIALLNLDEAVAVYAGSLADKSVEGDTGVFMYGLANSRALNFRTAGHQGNHDTGTAFVNVKIVDQFKHIQVAYQSLNATACVDAAARTEIIANLMKVPIIQSVLAYAYIRDRDEQKDEDTMEKAEGKGAAYTAAILPYIHKCNSMDATILYEQMSIGSDTDEVNFQLVKSALERTYECLNVTCADVGGVWDTDTQMYSKDARPCGLPSEKSGLNAGGIFGIAAAAIICAFLFIRYRKRNFWPRKSPKSVEDMSVGTIAAVSEIS